MLAAVMTASVANVLRSIVTSRRSSILETKHRLERRRSSSAEIVAGRSVEPRAGGFHHRRPFGDFGFDVGLELLRRAADDVDAEIRQRRLTSGSLSAVRVAKCSVPMTSLDTPAGATRPCQVVASKP